MENDEFRIDLSGDPLDRIIAHAREVIEITEGLLERQRHHLRELEAARGGVVETKQDAAIDGAGLTYSTQTTIETMRQDLALAANEIARLQAELDAVNSKLTAARAALEAIAVNAPQKEPPGRTVLPNASPVWAFWVAGKVAKAALVVLDDGEERGNGE